MPGGIKRILGKTAHFLYEARKSRLGLLLALLHAALFVLAISLKGPSNPKFSAWIENLSNSGGWIDATVFAGRSFHFNYEPLLLKMLFLLDWPALIACEASGIAVSPLLRYFKTSFYVQSYIAAVGFLLWGAVQWQLIGHDVQRRLRQSPKGALFVSWAGTHFVSIAFLIVVLTILIAPTFYYRAIASGSGQLPAFSLYTGK